MEPGTRKLVAIMFSDIAGYTALMGENEERAVHARGDRLVPFEAGGRELAAGIPGAKLVVLETDNHGFGPTDPTYPEYLRALDDFLAADPELADLYGCRGRYPSQGPASSPSGTRTTPRGQRNHG